jgi:RNA polymerase sigma-70 factor, ECF subfamily
LTTEPSQKSNLRFDNLSEQDVVKLAKLDPAAISFLYRQHYGAIYRYVNRRIGNPHDTTDIVAEVFMSMVRYLPSFRWTGAPFRCWLLKLATNQINRWIRKQKFANLWKSIDSQEPSISPPLHAEDDRLETMRRGLLTLPITLQTVLSLHYFEDLSIEAIAEIVNCRPGTVKSRLSRGRDLLRQKFTESKETTNEQ